MTASSPPDEEQRARASQAAARGVWATLRTLPRPVVMVLVGVTVNRLGTLFPLFLVLYVTSTGGRAAAAGLLLTAYGVGSIAGVVLGGWLVDRFGVRRTIVTSMALAGAAVGAVPLVSPYALRLAICLAVGLFTEAYRPAATSMLAERVSPQDMVVVSAAYRFAINVGATLAPLVGAVVAAWSLPLVFVVDGVTCALFAVVAASQLPAMTHDRPPAVAAGGGYRDVLRDRAFRRVVAGMFLIALVEVQYLATLPLEVTDRGFGSGVYAGLVSLNAALVLAIELPVTRVTRRWGLRTPLALGVALIGVGLALVGVRGGVAVLVVATVVWTVGEIISAPSATAYPALVAPAALRGRYLAAMNASQSVGYALGPTVGVVLLVHTGAGLWVACALAGGVAAGAMWTGAREVTTVSPQKVVETTAVASA